MDCGLHIVCVVILVSPGAETGLDKEGKATINNEMVSAARRITTLEMKELNERQRAEHAHKMYEHVRNSLKHVEDRNLELESKFTEVGHLKSRFSMFEGFKVSHFSLTHLKNNYSIVYLCIILGDYTFLCQQVGL